jgi:hypothetical protein
VAENQPGQFFGVGQLGIGDQFDHRLLRRAADLHAGFDSQSLAHGAHVQSWIVEQAIEAEDAALDVEFLAIGVEAAAARADRAASPWQVAALGGDADFAAQAAAQAGALEQKVAAEIGADVEIELGPQGGFRRLAAGTFDDTSSDSRGPPPGASCQ